MLLKAGVDLSIRNDIEGDTPLLALLRHKKKRSEHEWISEGQDKILDLMCTTHQKTAVDTLGKDGTSSLVFVRHGIFLILNWLTA